MAKIPKQRTGSGGWPDRRRAVTYSGKKGRKSSGGGGGGKKSCPLTLLMLLALPTGAVWGLVKTVTFVVTGDLA